MNNERKVISLKFNQDHGCFTCCMASGLRIYNIQPLVEKAHYDMETVGSVSQCEMLYRTNLIALVSSGGSGPKFTDNVLLIYDDLLKKFILDIAFPSSIKAVRLSTDKLIVALRSQIHVFSFPTKIERIFTVDTIDNPKGLCEIAQIPTNDRQIMVFPGHKKGAVQIVDLATINMSISSPAVWIPAHKNAVRCLALNEQGTRLATASHQGTLIRVWDTVSRKQLVELRRGSDPATIYCLNFSRDSEFLCCSSDKGTVHIFAVKNTSLNKRMLFPSGFFGTYGDSQWALANFTVPAEVACICAFGSNDSVIAVCVDGTFHEYTFNTGGTCNRKSYDIYLDVCDDDELYFL